jgi:tetratricopeptide (TPR) repeat protein
MSILQVVEFLQHLKIMKRKMRPGRSLLLLLGLVLLGSMPASGQTLDQALREYQEGRPDQARIMLDSLGDQEKNSSVAFLILGRTEPLGEQSESYLREALSRGDDEEVGAQAQLLMCQYEFCRGRYLAASDLVEGWDQKLPGVEAYPEALWISGSSFLAAQEPDSALVRFRRILADFPKSPWASWAQLGLGDCLLEAGDYDQAALSYKRVLEYHRYSEAFPFALSGLAECYSSSGNSEEALLYHNLLEERFPQNPESFQALSPANAPRSPEEEGKAERLAGVRYTIQLGVFGVRENALGLKKRLEEQGYRVRMETRMIGGKKYQVVQLGSFDSYQEALDLKKKLEAQTGEAYRVVIR